MNWSRYYELEGVWQNIETKAMVVPVDVVTHFENAKIPHDQIAVIEPHVVFRTLEMDMKVHVRYAMPVSEFKLKFEKV
jgi:hypothetical protein